MTADIGVFVSYARSEATQAEQLVADLRRIADRVWFDAHVTGGQQWWDAILDQIESCDVFVIALSPASLKSDWCRIEAEWARSLNRPILPLQLVDLDLSLAPRWLRDRQFVPYLERSVETTLTIVDAVTQLTRYEAPTPADVPSRPAMPVGPFEEEREKIGRPELYASEQSKLLVVLTAGLGIEDQRDEAAELLRLLADRDDVTRASYDACVAALASLVEDHAEPPAGQSARQPLKLGASKKSTAEGEADPPVRQIPTDRKALKEAAKAAGPETFVTCDACGATLKAKNLVSHHDRQHPGQFTPRAATARPSKAAAATRDSGWLSVTGTTLPEAIDLALAKLGVPEAEAEIVVMEEPKPGLFGRTRGNSRIRARRKPQKP